MKPTYVYNTDFFMKLKTKSQQDGESAALYSVPPLSKQAQLLLKMTSKSQDKTLSVPSLHCSLDRKNPDTEISDAFSSDKLDTRGNYGPSTLNQVLGSLFEDDSEDNLDGFRSLKSKTGPIQDTLSNYSNYMSQNQKKLVRSFSYSEMIQDIGQIKPPYKNSDRILKRSKSAPNLVSLLPRPANILDINDTMKESKGFIPLSQHEFDNKCTKVSLCGQDDRIVDQRSRIKLLSNEEAFEFGLVTTSKPISRSESTIRFADYLNEVAKLVSKRRANQMNSNINIKKL